MCRKYLHGSAAGGGGVGSGSAWTGGCGSCTVSTIGVGASISTEVSGSCVTVDTDVVPPSNPTQKC